MAQRRASLPPRFKSRRVRSAVEVSSWCSKVRVSPEHSETKPVLGFTGLKEGHPAGVGVATGLMHVTPPRAARLSHQCRQATSTDTISLSWKTAQNLLSLVLCLAHRCLCSDLSGCLPIIPFQTGSADAAFHAFPCKSTRGQHQEAARVHPLAHSAWGLRVAQAPRPGGTLEPLCRFPMLPCVSCQNGGTMPLGGQTECSPEGTVPRLWTYGLPIQEEPQHKRKMHS